MMEQRIVGTWRTYKLFHFNGKVDVHHTSYYVELWIDQHHGLSMFQGQTKRQATILKPEEWKFEEVKKRLFLYFGKKQAFEIITLETEDLVLADVVKGEKLFFAKMPAWYQRIEPIITSTRHIKPEEETKDQ